MPATRENLPEIFTFHTPTPEQIELYAEIRAKGQDLARLMLDERVPKCADQQAAIRKLREAVMTVNAAIATRGVV